jgi:hypothetical protein
MPEPTAGDRVVGELLALVGAQAEGGEMSGAGGSPGRKVKSVPVSAGCRPASSRAAIMVAGAGTVPQLRSVAD